MFLPMSWTSPLTVAMTILPFALASPPRVDQRRLLGLDVGQQVGDRLLHHARRLHHLRQEHLALAEQVADDVHAGHQRPFDHVQRPAARGLDRCAGLLGVLDDEVGDAVDQRVREPLVDRLRLLGACRARRGAPSRRAAAPLARSAISTRRSPASWPAVEHDVLDALAQLGLEVVVDADHAGVDDAHVHARLDRVVEEHGVDRLAHRVVAAEREAHVGDAARDLGAAAGSALIQRVASMKSTA